MTTKSYSSFGRDTRLEERMLARLGRASTIPKIDAPSARACEGRIFESRWKFAVSYNERGVWPLEKQ